jgi:predicted HicB family RNase H-like nuclease
MLKYRGYVGHFFFDEKENLFQGNIANTHHLIPFQGKSVERVKQAFQDAVDEYIDWSQKINKPLKKPSLVSS